MIIRDAKLETVCGYGSVLPENDLMEVAFAGRSNVGKSSLINMMMNRKSLARTSSEPGKTRTINYYRVDAFVKEVDSEGNESRRDVPFYLVDLPGYGYARVSRTEAEKWGSFIDRYLHDSRQLREVFLLLDIRRDPDDKDRQMYDWICASGRKPVIVVTKADKIKRSGIKKRLNEIKRGLQAPGDQELYPVSTLDRSGLEALYAILEKA